MTRGLLLNYPLKEIISNYHIKYNYTKSGGMSGPMLKFLSIINKLLIFISLITFIPLTVLVFSIKDPHLGSGTQSLSHAIQQIQSPFIVDYFRDANNNPLCTYREALFNNHQCFRKANSQEFTVTSDTLLKCVGGYTINSKRYCPGSGITEIKNTFNNQNNPPQFVHTNLTTPIFSILPQHHIKEGSLSANIIRYSCLSRDNKCLSAANQLQNFQDKSYSMVLTCKDSLLLMWCLLLLMLVSLILMLILNKIISDMNGSPYIFMLFLCHNCIGIFICSRGLAFYTQFSHLKSKLNIFHQCFAQPLSKDLQKMYEQVDYGVSEGFFLFIGIICLLLVLTLAVEVAIKIIEARYYAHKDDYIESGYQLRAV